MHTTPLFRFYETILIIARPYFETLWECIFVSRLSRNLLIVESPAKAKTIEKILGSDFEVRSCYGHIRDLEKDDMGIDVKNNFKPRYIVPDEKKKVVNDLKQMAKKSKEVWLATDEDREGEAISWHLCEVLGLDPASTKTDRFSRDHQTRHSERG
jgi:DNA topoisomerase IA